MGTLSVYIKNSTKILRLKLIIKQNGQTDYAGIDNIKLEGLEITPCNNLLISEYIEGSSSTSHRNNFIEIHNPTNVTIDLNNYDLVKYTGKSTTVSNILILTGSIPAYGTFLIEDSNENLGVTSNLSTNNAVMDFTGDDKIALRNSDQIIDLIGNIGDSINFAKDVTLRRKSNVQNPNNQFAFAEWDTYSLEDIGNINSHLSTCNGVIPEIEVKGNQESIVDGSLITSSSNNTYFGMVDFIEGDEIIKTFYLKNLGNTALNIGSVNITGPNFDNFSILTQTVINIQPKDSSELSISFKPNSIGIKTASVTIENNDASENPFTFYIQGESTGISNSPIMITQYYEGSGSNKWIEIKNISKTQTPENTYYLALYWNDDAKSPIGNKPSRNYSLPAMSVGEILKFRSTLAATEPAYAIDGKEIASSICGFTGDDILVLSTSNDETCWENRIDIIGKSSNWGVDISFVRKYGCEEVEPNTGYDSSDWFNYDIIDINNALKDSNQRIGNHYIGTTTFINTNKWDNGIPDQYRTATINQKYDSSTFGNLDVCNLIINSSQSLNIDPGNYVAIKDNLTVDGFLQIQHEGTLHMLKNNGTVINNGIINIHKTTTVIQKNDYTYWSSPIKNANLESVFSASPQNSFYSFETQNYLDNNNDNLDDDENAWRRAGGEMTIGKGYTAMAPDTDPFIEQQSVIFSGNVNNGLINVPVYLSEDVLNDDDDWNLIGNPYPSAISADLFLNDIDNRDLLSGSIYYWTHNTAANTNNGNQQYSSDDYAIYNTGTGGIQATSLGEIPTGIIASGQGFFVEAINNGNIVFKNEMRVKLGNNNFFKEDNIKTIFEKKYDKIWLNIFNEKGAFSQILIGFIEDASEQIERKYDAIRLSTNNYLNFYTIIDDQHLAIQGTNSFTGNEIIQLGYSTIIKDQAILKIGIDHLEGKLKEKDIYLYDSLLQKTHNLKISDYQFSLENQGVFNNRFQLKFNNPISSIENSEIVQEYLIINQVQDILYIKTNHQSVLSSIKIYDILGRVILDKQIHKKVFSVNHHMFKSSGIYILRVELKNSKVLRKKIIK